MDNENSVGTQYIICECGDNFPNEKFLNIHLSNGHGDVEAFQCDACPELFTSINSLSRHTIIHHSQTTEEPKIKIQELKTYSRKPPKEIKEEIKDCPELFTSINSLSRHTIIHHSQTTEEPKIKIQELKTYSRRPPKEIKEEIKDVKEVKVKKPPVIKLKNLKRIDSISLIESLKSFGGIIKLEVPAPDPEPEPEPEPELEPEPEPQLELELEPQPEEEDSMQVIVKHEETKETNEDEEEIYYQCDVCKAIFYTEWDFNIHYQSAHALKLEPSAEQILEQHLVTDHADDEGVKAEADTAYYYECELCHKIFASEKYFNIHYNKMHGGLLPVEEAENEEDPGELMQETEEEESKPKVPEQVIYYKCDLCKILYPSEKAYNTHFDKKHGGQSCNEVQTGFRLIEQELSDTVRYDLVNVEDREMFTCEYCPKTFTMKRSVAVHRKRAHAEQLAAVAAAAAPPRPHSRSKVCDVCGRAYNSNAALRYHQRRHTGEKPYPCTICPKRFTMPMFLQIHMRTHTGEKPYECPHCPKAFTNKAALIRHDRVHTGVKPYACPECGKLFTQSNSMKLHVSTVHLKLPAPYKSKSRRNKSEARALQLALKNLPVEELVIGED